MKNKRPVRVLVVGSINMDLVLDLDRVPDTGETVLGKACSYIPGGKGANQAVAAARLGGDVTMCGRIGRDSNGKVLHKNLSDNHIHTDCLATDEASQTGLAVIPVDAEGQNRIMVFSGANKAMAREDVDQALLISYDVVILQLEIPPDIVYYACERASAMGIPVILDAGPAIELDLSRLKGIDIISPNESEASLFTGIQIKSRETAVQSARILYEATNPSYVLIKLGSKGSLLYRKGKYEFFPAFDIKAVDTTAAGDSFTAAVALKWIEYGDIRKAIRYATAVGAICVSRQGAQPSLPAEKEVLDFLNAKGLMDI